MYVGQRFALSGKERDTKVTPYDNYDGKFSVNIESSVVDLDSREAAVIGITLDLPYTVWKQIIKTVQEGMKQDGHEA